VTIAAAIGIATTAYTAYETDQNVQAQNKNAKQTAKEGSKLARASFINQTNLANLRSTQESEAASTELTANAKDAAKARATARVSAGEAGVSGVSVDALINDFYDQEAGYSEGVKRNLQLGREQTQADLMGMRSNAQDRSLSLRQPLQARPSYFATGLNIAGQGAQGYMRYKYSNTNQAG
jgi:hypothetical protein